MRHTVLGVSAFLSLLMLGCASAGSGSKSERDVQLITEEEIVAARSLTAYDAVKQLRGNFLSYRGKTSLVNNESANVPTVYLDDQEYGPLLSLKTIPANQVVEIRLYRAWEATTRFGAGNMGGVIAVATRH